MPALQPRRWTVEDVHALPDDGNRYECLDGELIVSPSPRNRHQQAVLELALALGIYLRAEPVGTLWIAPSDLILGPDTLLQPDLRVHAAGPKASASERKARSMLIVEVLSASTARYDRGDKRAAYLRRATALYWIVDLDSEVVEVWTPGHARPQIVSDVLTWHSSGAATPFSLPLAPFFAQVNAWD